MWTIENFIIYCYKYEESHWFGIHFISKRESRDLCSFQTLKNLPTAKLLSPCRVSTVVLAGIRRYKALANNCWQSHLTVNRSSKAEMKPLPVYVKNKKQNLEDTINTRNKYIRQTT